MAMSVPEGAVAANPKHLLSWYDAHARALPWRAPPGASPPDAYAVWLSEIMLQQTTVAAVMPYFERFLARWPTIAALAAAPVEDVLATWAGLGYYSRARNLHACARAVVERHGGRFPETEAALRALPGIGDYTAAAIAAIAFQQPAVVVDGNVERVMARLERLEESGPRLKAAVRERLRPLAPQQRPGDFAQAMMDLGATLCTPRNPQCQICPWRAACKGAAHDDAATFPRKAAKAARPQRFGIAWWHEQEGRVLLVRRPSSGLLGGLLALPTTEWTLEPQDLGGLHVHGAVDHVFTHFRLTLTVASGGGAPPDGAWVAREALDAIGLPSLFLKAARLVTGLRLDSPPAPA